MSEPNQKMSLAKLYKKISVAEPNKRSPWLSRWNISVEQNNVHDQAEQNNLALAKHNKYVSGWAEQWSWLNQAK